MGLGATATGGTSATAGGSIVGGTDTAVEGRVPSAVVAVGRAIDVAATAFATAAEVPPALLASAGCFGFFFRREGLLTLDEIVKWIDTHKFTVRGGFFG